ncbi:hypothetical protein MishRS11D_28950 [Methylomagnum ishizawai]|nr:hypothetical protein MishRS11D_28950 [Methylomagnum ishizawai]
MGAAVPDGAGPSERADEAANRRHKTTVDWTAQAVKQVSRWLEATAFTVVGDGAYACVALAHACSANRATLVSRLRLDARLFGFRKPRRPASGGANPRKASACPA